MSKCLFIVIILVFAFQNSFAQQNNVWYFGRNAGLNFNSSGSQPVPAVLSDGALVTNEGSASICDANGDILFYTNGVTVYNRNHQPMMNGQNIAGNISSVQGSIIVPIPGNDSIYYLFATDAFEHLFQNGYTYSIINMRGDGGNGEVITKNISLWPSCTERMVAARHANGRDVWLITNDKNSNVFRSWLIDCSGLQTTPAVSTVGVVLDQHILTNNGMLKVSPDGKQLCQTHFAEVDVITLVPNFCQLFDFNSATGILSNPRTIGFGDSRIIATEFSNDSKLLYLTNPDRRTIDQLECTLPSTPAILASRVSIPAGASGKYYGIQLAPDGKIYLSDVSSYLGAINFPDVKGAGCTFNARQILLSPGSSTTGLPAYINDLSGSPNNGFSMQITDSCTGVVQFNGLTTMPGSISWNWDFGDGNTSTLQNPTHTFSPSNKSYTVMLEITVIGACGYVKRSKTIFPGGLAATADFDFNVICDAGTVTFNNLSTLIPDSTGVHYLWTFGDGNTSTLRDPVHSYPLGNYTIRLDVLTTTSCLNRSVTKSLNLDPLNIVASPDQEITAGETAQLGTTGGGTRFVWTPSTGLSNATIANPLAKPRISTMYVVTAFNDAGCSDIDSVFIKVKPVPGIYVPSGFTPNNDGKNDVFRPYIADEFILNEFSIYNRWGQKVFSTSQKDNGWNGKVNGIIQDSGVYVWIVNAFDTINGKKQEEKGTFVIIR